MQVFVDADACPVVGAVDEDLVVGEGLDVEFYFREALGSEAELDAVLQRCNIRLSNYVSNVDSKSYKAVVRAISQA